MLVTLLLARHHGLSRDFETEIVQELHRLPAIIKDLLALDDAIAALDKRFANNEHALYQGEAASTHCAGGCAKVKSYLIFTQRAMRLAN